MPGKIPYPFELLTERLRICSPAVEHARQLQDALVASYDALVPWMSWIDHVPTVEETLENCRKAVEDFQEGRRYRMHLFLQETGEMVGCSGLPKFDLAVPRFEIGYWVNLSHTGRGYITEAVRAITGHAFEKLGAVRVEIHANSRNIRSCRVAERAGFEFEGRLRNHRREPDGSLGDTSIYAVVRVTGE